MANSGPRVDGRSSSDVPGSVSAGPEDGMKQNCRNLNNTIITNTTMRWNYSKTKEIELHEQKTKQVQHYSMS